MADLPPAVSAHLDQLAAKYDHVLDRTIEDARLMLVVQPEGREAIMASLAASFQVIPHQVLAGMFACALVRLAEGPKSDG